MSGRFQASHVDIYDDPLPLPLTTRNLRPRVVRALYRPTPHSQEAPSHISSQPSRHRDLHMQSNIGASTSKAEPSNGDRIIGEGSSKTRRKTSTSPRKRRKRIRRVQSSTSVSEEQVDQLIASDDDANSNPRKKGATESGGASLSSSSSNPRQPVTVSSPSLRKILHPSNIDSSPQSSSKSELVASTASPPVEVPTDPPISVSQASTKSSPPAAEPLSDYTCPICFYPPTNATLTPCGHVCCGSCLFVAVKSTQRAAMNDANDARCPVCRATIPGWDGRGGGVIGLKPSVVLAL